MVRNWFCKTICVAWKMYLAVFCSVATKRQRIIFIHVNPCLFEGFPSLTTVVMERHHKNICSIRDQKVAGSNPVTSTTIPDSFGYNAVGNFFTPLELEIPSFCETLYLDIVLDLVAPLEHGHLCRGKPVHFCRSGYLFYGDAF